MKVSEGKKAPCFKAKDQNGQTIDLCDFIGHQSVVLYFYPKNFTPGCTAQACSFRDHFQDFTDAGASVFGISNDNSNSHARFVKKYNLPYTMLSDKDGKIRKLYGVKGDLFGLLPGRETFVIDPSGVVRLHFDSMDAKKHIPKALEIVKNLQDV